MTKDKWIQHMEDSTGLTRPSIRSYNKESWDASYQRHILDGCPECHNRAKTRKANTKQRARHQAYLDCGMVRVRGALGGVYYE